MSYDHSLYMELHCKEGTTQDQVLDALRPLFEACHCAVDLDEMMKMGFLKLEKDGEGFVTFFHASTEGDVGDSYQDFVQAVAQNLAKFCHTGEITLKDMDTADVENAVSTIWVGEGEDLVDYQRQSIMNAWAQAALDTGCFTSNQVASIKEFAVSMPIEQERSAPTPKAG